MSETQSKVKTKAIRLTDTTRELFIELGFEIPEDARYAVLTPKEFGFLTEEDLPRPAMSLVIPKFHMLLTYDIEITLDS